MDSGGEGKDRDRAGRSLQRRERPARVHGRCDGGWPRRKTGTEAAEEQSRAVLGYWRCPSLATVWGWLGGVFRC